MSFSPVKAATRSPLKETDSNLRAGSFNEPVKETQLLQTQELDNNNTNINNNINIITTSNNKKRSLERLELQQKKKPKAERARSIEGAVLVSKPTVLKNVQSKVTPKELLDWQNNWKKIMRRDSRIYFDTTEDNADNLKSKKSLDKKRELLKRGFLSLDAQITKFFDTNVTIVITTRSTDNLHLLNDADILSRAKKNFMKVWGYEKAFRFLSNLDVDFNAILKNKVPVLATPTLSNLLQNEKLYGPTDRDPRTKRDDIHYFKHPYVYMYDLWQTWAPIITLEWRQQDLSDEENLPYPILKMGTFGRCPFIGDRYCIESSARRILKRYKRDQINYSYALKLRQLYQYRAIPQSYNNDISEEDILFIPHACQDSATRYETLVKGNASSDKTSIIPQSSDNDMVKSKSVPNIVIPDLNETTSNKTQSEAKPTEVINLDNTIDDPDKSIIEIKYNNEADSNNNTIPNINNNNIDQTKDQTVWKEPITPSLKHTPLVALQRQETEDLQDDLCATSKRQSRVPFEIKASGAHQSNDVATSFGNGLGPTKSTVMSKNIRTLNKLVDRKLDGPIKKNGNCKPPINSTTPGLARCGSNLKHSFGREAMIDPDVNETQQKRKLTVQLPSNNENKPVVKKPVVKNSGYCENCRVKYDSLDEHIVSEKHLTFANNDLNFEAIDCLIEKLGFQF